jgi:hypothetical protein
MCDQFVSKLLKKSDLNTYIFIFNCIINNLNFFRLPQKKGKFAPQQKPIQSGG